MLGAMRLLALLAALVLGCGSSPPVQRPGSSPAAKPEHREMLAAMERYLAAPLDASTADLARIHDFVLKDHDVEVVIDLAARPFFDDELDDDAASRLMTGFVAGNAAEQLRTGTRGDALAAGVDGELAVYRAVKAAAATRYAGKKVTSPGLDRLAQLAASGKLRAHLGQVLVDRRNHASVKIIAEDGTSGAGAAEGRGDGTEDAEDAEDADDAALGAGAQLVQSGQPEAAITDYFDKLIARFEKRYAGEKRHIYCAHSQAETLLYMVTAANKHEDAVALSSTWAEAWFLKSYALTELHRSAEARAALEKALALSPSYARYLSEYAYLHHQTKDWKRSLELYKQAEDSVKLISDPKVQVIEHTRALRGQGYALVELGDLDAAEARYRASLQLDPDDEISKKELEYVQQQRGKRK